MKIKRFKPQEKSPIQAREVPKVKERSQGEETYTVESVLKWARLGPRGERLSNEEAIIGMKKMKRCSFLTDFHRSVIDEAIQQLKDE